jgi:5-methylcytosine-specific restriction endonuclease McrA
LAEFHECASCKSLFVSKDVEVNHKVPVVPVTGFDSWDGVIERLFCEADGLEVVCKTCHKEITKQEREQRKENK